METPSNLSYVAAAGADNIIATSYAVLKRIIVGKNVSTSTIEVSDSATDGDGNVKFYLEGDALAGTYELNAIFENGIAADLTNQTNVMFVWEPLPHPNL